MKLTEEQLELDHDYDDKERAKKHGCYQLQLELPKGFEVMGHNQHNRILIRKNPYGGQDE